MQRTEIYLLRLFLDLAERVPDRTLLQGMMPPTAAASKPPSARAHWKARPCF
jgi:hypothetical protein